MHATISRLPNFARTAQGMADGGIAGQDPCQNPDCASFGVPHPNCQCYAFGGVVQGYADGTPDQPVVDMTPQAPNININVGQPQTLPDPTFGQFMQMQQPPPAVVTPPAPAPNPWEQVSVDPYKQPPPVDTTPQATLAPAMYMDPNAPFRKPDQVEPDRKAFDQRDSQMALLGRQLAEEGNAARVLSNKSADAHQRMGKVDEAVSNTMAEFSQAYTADITTKKDEFDQKWNKWQGTIDDAYKAASKGKIDPNDYWKTKDADGNVTDDGTGKKIMAGIGMIFSGFGQGASGAAGIAAPNMAMMVIDKAIDRNIDAQKANLAQANNMFRMAVDAAGNLEQGAKTYAGLAHMAVAGQLEALAQKSNSLTARDRALIAANQERQKGIFLSLDAKGKALDNMMKRQQFLWTYQMQDMMRPNDSEYGRSNDWFQNQKYAEVYGPTAIRLWDGNGDPAGRHVAAPNAAIATELNKQGEFTAMMTKSVNDLLSPIRRPTAQDPNPPRLIDAYNEPKGNPEMYNQAHVLVNNIQTAAKGLGIDGKAIGLSDSAWSVMPASWDLSNIATLKQLEKTQQENYHRNMMSVVPRAQQYEVSRSQWAAQTNQGRAAQAKARADAKRPPLTP